MEYLVQLLSSLGQDPVAVQWILIAMIAGTIFVAGMGVLMLVSGAFNPVRKRLYDAVGYEPTASIAAARVTKTMHALSPYILPKQGWQRSQASQRMVHAGYRSANALPIYYAVRTLFIIVLPALVFLAAPWFPKFSPNQVLFAAAVAAFIGMIVPSYVLDRKVDKRKRWLSNGFPDALDLLVVCTEAGLGLNAALQRVARDLAVSHPALAEELALVNAEIRAGVDRVEALKNLATRTGLEDIKGLVVLLAQSLRFGTSIAETLRVYSEDFRDKRMQRAEEAAAKIATKMIFPLVTCLFPSFFIVAIGPAVIQIIAGFTGIGR